MKKIFNKIQKKCNDLVIRTKCVISGNAGEGYIDTGVKIIIGVVIGGVILAGLYALFNTTIIPSMQSKLAEMFNYAG